MKALRIKKLVIDTPEFDPHPERSKTDNHSWRQVFQVIMTDDEGNEFNWIPRNVEVKQINNALNVADRTNSEIARAKFEEKNEKGE